MLLFLFFIFIKQFSRNVEQYINSTVILVCNTETVNELLVPAIKN